MRDKAAGGASQGGMVSALRRAESDKCRDVRLRQNRGRSNQAAKPRIVSDGRADGGVGSLELVTAPVDAQAMRKHDAPDESQIKKARHEIIRVGLGIW